MHITCIYYTCHICQIYTCAKNSPPKPHAFIVNAKTNPWISYLFEHNVFNATAHRQRLHFTICVWYIHRVIIFCRSCWIFNVIQCCHFPVSCILILSICCSIVYEVLFLIIKNYNHVTISGEVTFVFFFRSKKNDLEII